MSSLNLQPQPASAFQLDEHQTAVRDHGLGPSLVAGAPGSGKSRSVVSRVIRLVRAGVRPEHILVLTFTRAACGEVLHRLESAGVPGVEVRTFHSLCFHRIKKIWPEGMRQVAFDERGALPYHMKIVAKRLRRQGAIQVSDALDVRVLETFISRCKNLGPFHVHGNPFQVSEAASRQNVMDVAEAWLSQRIGMSAEDAFTFFREVEERRWELGLYGYDDAQGWLWQSLAGSQELQGWWASQWSVVIVDEAQDSSSIQHSIARLAVGLPDAISGAPGTDRDHNLMLCSDLAQCLDPDSTEVSLPGPEDATIVLGSVRQGMQVLSCAKGWPVPQVVEHVGQQTKMHHARITLEDGRALDGSNDHLVFACMPASNDRFYTYLMYRKGMGFRLGVTQGAKNKTRHSVAARALNENADRLWLLNAHETSASAGYEESRLSLLYQVPTMPFNRYGRGLRVREEEISRMFAEFGDNGRRVLTAFRLLFDWPTFMPQTYVTNRLVLSVILSRGDKHDASEVVCESQILQQPAVREALLRDFGITPREGRRGTGVIRVKVSSGAEAHDLALRISRAVKLRCEEIDCTVRVALSAAQGPNKEKIVAIPLGSLVPGCQVWTQEGCTREVVRLERYDALKVLADLQVAKTTSYYANGICVHNSLYSWRTADPAQILQFMHEYKPVVYTLPNNYRSTDRICETASRVIEGRPWNLTGAIRPIRGVPGAPIEMRSFPGRREELEFCLAVAREEGLGRTAVLSRTAGILHWLSILCTKQGIPFRKLAGGFLFDTREARDLLNYLRVATGADPDGSSLRAIVNVPFRYIGAKAFRGVAEAQAAGRATGDLLSDLLEHGSLAYPQRRSIVRFRDILDKLQDRAGRAPAEALRWLVDVIEYEDHMAEEMGLSSASEDEGASIVLEELLEYAAGFETATELLTHVEYLRGLHNIQKQRDAAAMAAGDTERLTLATCHGMKGLEAPVVVLANVSYGVFPSGRVRQDPVLAEEELRILYVAVSRAKDRLIVTRAKRLESCRDSPFWRLLAKISSYPESQD